MQTLINVLINGRKRNPHSVLQKNLRYFLPLFKIGLERQKEGREPFPLKRITYNWMHCFQNICANFGFTCVDTVRTWYI